jgi:hypothetical protein
MAFGTEIAFVVGLLNVGIARVFALHGLLPPVCAATEKDTTVDIDEEEMPG